MHSLSDSKKIMIIGNCGTGKSTLSIKLGKILDIPVIHLDKLYFNPGWQEIDKPTFFKKVENEMNGKDKWIIDGNYNSSIENRAKIADTIIFLKVPLIISYYRIIKRRIIFHKDVRPDVAEGCKENLNWEMMKWMWDYKKRALGKTNELIEKNKNSKNIIILNSPAKVKEFVRSIEA